MNNDRIAFVGFGFVGKALHTLFAAAQPAIYDPALGALDKAGVNRCDFAFVCVPTPTKGWGECDTSIVEEAVGWIESPIIVIRSTVPPGTTDRLRQSTGKHIVFQPEYVGETVAHPLLDHQAQGFSILGGPMADASLVADLYKRYYHASHRFYFTDSTTAELAKYMENAFYAVKVTFCNEFYDIARTLGVDYNELRECWLADPRISRDHTFVYPDNRGFSGKCLPKDTAAIINSATSRDMECHLLKATMRANCEYRPANDPIWQQYADLFNAPRT